MDDFIDIHGIFASSLVFTSHTQETRCTRIYIDTVMTNDEIEGCIFSLSLTFIPFFPSRVSLNINQDLAFFLLNISVSQHSFSLSFRPIAVSIWTPFSSHWDIWIERRLFYAFFREEMGGCQDTCSTGRSGSSFIFMSNGLRFALFLSSRRWMKMSSRTIGNSKRERVVVKRISKLSVTQHWV